MSRSRPEVVAYAAQWIGTGEDPPGSNHNRFTDAYGMTGAWCDMFATDCLGRPEERFASTVLDVADARRRGIFREGAAGGLPGDKIFFHWPGSSRGASQPDHVEIIDHPLADGSGYVTIGGNVGDRVQRLVRRANILGTKAVAYDDAPASPAPAPAPPRHTMAYPGHFIRRGSNDHTAVRYVQEHVGSPVDGIFGPNTLRAVRAFQRGHGLGVDGVVGPRTWAALGS